MNELNDEIKLTLNLMQTDIDDGLREVMQYHLAGLLEIKRNELQQRLVERAWLDHADGMGSVVKFDQAPYKSVKLDGQAADEVKQLTVGELMTAEELKAGGWWCGDTSESCRLALESFGFKFFACIWDSEFDACFVDSFGDTIGRGPEIHATSTLKLKQIHRIGNEFYWGDV